MDDDEEDYQALFFTECSEGLLELQEHLNLLMSGDGDDETLNAAFRTVHSIKGGASAFGFDHLISFAHAFETVMDIARSGNLELTDEVCQTFLRSGDCIEVLVEQARDGGDLPKERIAKVLEELHLLAGFDPPEQSDGDAEAAAEEAPAEEAAEDEGPSTREVRILFKPDETIFQSGHDPLRMIAAARAHGLYKVEPVGEIPMIEDLALDQCPLNWRLYFDVEVPAKDLLDFFLVYEAAASAELEYDEADEAGEEDTAEEAAKPEASAEPAPAEKAETAEAAPAAAEAGAAPAGNASAPPAEKPGGAKPAAPAPANAGSGGGKKAEGGRQGGPKKASKTLRVDLTRVDRMVNLVGEIVITQAAVAQRLSDADGIAELEVGHSVEAMSRQIRELQESVMAIRAQPVKSVFSRMPRVVRDLADTLGKDVQLVLSGENTEVDTTVIEELTDPLTHMLRNSMDHGIENPEDRVAAGKPARGTIHLSAEQRGERVVITVSDDGKGINREVVLKKAIERGLVSAKDTLTPEEIDLLVFHPGFSTAAQISNVSGRGVGMDVVMKNIQAIGGRVTVKNTPGQGASFFIALPLTLAVLDGMTICVGKERFILPLSSVVEALRIENMQVERLPDKSRVLARRGEYLKLYSLRKTLGLAGAQSGTDDESMAIIVDTESNGLVALLVDDLLGQRQVVLKSLEANFKRIEGVSGATILGDGQVALILDVPSLVSAGEMRSTPEWETLH